MPKLVIISGMIRSGTTLMSRIMNAHNNIGIASDVLLPIMKNIRSVYLKKTHDIEYNKILDGYFDRTIDYIRMDNILDEELESEIVDKILLHLDNTRRARVVPQGHLWRVFETWDFHQLTDFSHVLTRLSDFLKNKRVFSKFEKVI